MSPLPQNVALVLLAAMGVLAAAAVVRSIHALRERSPAARERLGSLIVWWVIVGLLLLASAAGNVGGCLLMAGVSLLALREFVRLTQPSRNYQGAQAIAYLLLPAQYACVGLGWMPLVWTLVPLGTPVLAAAWLIARGRTRGYIAAVTALSWGSTLCVFCLSHAALLWQLPQAANPQAGGAGWLVYLVLLSQSSDIAQALWGRALGRRKIAPVVSPGKTWEGFLLGGASTVALAVVLAMPLTPLVEGARLPPGEAGVTIPYLPAVLAGLIVWLGGFIGDLNISALKRDLGVKDTGTLLPSQGGILDRVDSLTFAAPLFFYYVYALYGAGKP
jgi:phosphatidate cytidylyltransferase